ncbi:chromosome segregation protein SMC [Candidatus Pacearchaeota archaeon]|nr:chromosome segregation protein SMC [Candidatus Pacearchaeota archaeon]
MPHVKKLVMHGFKSFAGKTEIPFTPEINIILGPNGSGKSNISDALCFVLGRLGIKSMRASKSGNLIFRGTKQIAPSKEASVELVFDNSDRIFSINNNEVSIERIVRKNGQGIYKINGETKTRQDILSLLAQAGIDPNGFNIILQGEIHSFVRMQSLERRKVLEEVSGISIYEIRKEKSLKELEKTEEKLKEVQTILRERTSYLNNLEYQRQQALKYKKLEGDIKKFKASVISGELLLNKKEMEKIDSEILVKTEEASKLKREVDQIREKIIGYESKIKMISNTMQKSTGFEQDKLNQEIANLRAEIAGMNVKVENCENKLSEISRQKSEMEKTLRETEVSIKGLKQESPSISKKNKEAEQKKIELEKLQNEVKKFYMMKSDLKSIKEKVADRKTTMERYATESDFLLKQINNISTDVFDIRTDKDKVDILKKTLSEKLNLLKELNSKQMGLEKLSYKNDYEINKHNQMIEKIAKIDICPVCKSKITPKHVHSINSEFGKEISSMAEQLKNAEKEISQIEEKKRTLESEINNISFEISKREQDVIKIAGINEKKSQLIVLDEKIKVFTKEITELEKTKKKIEGSLTEISLVEKKYETARVELQEISVRSEENVTSEISFKQREFERLKISLKQILREEEDFSIELDEHKLSLQKKEDLLAEKREQDEELSKKFEKLILEKNNYEKKIREEELDGVKKQNMIHNIEQETNKISIAKAEIKARIENLEVDYSEYKDIEVIKAPRHVLLEKIERAKTALMEIGSVNLLSLEVYDSVKKEYDTIKNKSDTIEKEKEEIMKIINEIDSKKKKTFMKTLNELNTLFSNNFNSLSVKGEVFLDLENKKDPFEAGVSIVLKTGHGKYFDVASLSGGEQTLVALALIFAIQEYRPYSFYILDEIDADLDKRNSARLAELLNKYMKKGQYIVITHNDEVVSNANVIYGVSMHEDVSKIISMKI